MSSAEVTRNLYRVDEVVAALQWCCLKGRTVEAAFWALELPLSAAAEALRIAWLYGFGCRALGLLPAILSDNVDPVVIATALAGKYRRLRDSSVISILTMRVREERLTVGPVPAGLQPQEAFAARAAAAGKVGPVWDWLATSEEIPWDVVYGIGTWKHGEELRGTLEILKAGTSFRSAELKALVCAILCLRSTRLKESLGIQVPNEKDPDPEIASAVQEWSALKGRRRRVYEIPYDCLHGATERGGLEVSQSTEKEIRDLRALEKALVRSAVWSVDFRESQTGDEEREEFYDTWFPTDIPDEWSAADRKKSHGSGPVPAGATTWTLGRWLRRWFELIPSCLIWEGVLEGAARLDAEFEWDPHSSAWEGIRDGAFGPEAGATEWNRRLVKKRKIVPRKPTVTL